MNKDDAAILQIGRLFEKAEQECSKCNVELQELVKAIGERIEFLSRSNDVRVVTTLHEPFSFCGSISVRGKELFIQDTVEFVKALRTADNVEIYPMTTGEFQMNLGYNGLME